MPSRDERKLHSQFFQRGQRVEVRRGCKIASIPVLPFIDLREKMRVAPTKRLLFVDDEDNIRLTLPRILEKHGFKVTAVGNVADALAQMDHNKYDVLISDLNIEKPGDGFSVVAAMHDLQPKCTNVILTGYPDFESALQAIRLSVADYFVKPVDIEALSSAIKKERVRKVRKAVRPAKVH
jgi:DNA-binding NtrC family response regulator